MSNKFSVKQQANSLSKLMAMASLCMKEPGGAIHTERLIDYTSGEFARLTMEQCLEVLSHIDKGYQKKLFRDGYGVIIGYAYSKRIFVTLRREESPADRKFANLAKKMKKGRTT